MLEAIENFMRPKSFSASGFIRMENYSINWEKYSAGIVPGLLKCDQEINERNS